MRFTKQYYLSLFSEHSERKFNEKVGPLAGATRELIKAHLNEKDGNTDGMKVEVAKPAELVYELSKIILQDAAGERSAISQSLITLRGDVISHFKVKSDKIKSDAYEVLVEIGKKLEDLRDSPPEELAGNQFIETHVVRFITSNGLGSKDKAAEAREVVPPPSSPVKVATAAIAVAASPAAAQALSPSASNSSPLTPQRGFMNGLGGEQKDLQQTASYWFHEAEKYWNTEQKLEYVDECFNKSMAASWKEKEVEQWKITRGKGLHYMNWASFILRKDNPDYDAAIIYFERAKTCFENILGAPEGQVNAEDTIAANHKLVCELISTIQTGKKQLTVMEGKDAAAEPPRVTSL